MEVATGVLGIFHAAHFKQVLKIEQQVSQPLILVVVVVDQANIQTTSQ
jgi:glycerol-3-phosphate cytidylyltransferase-like family protein